MAAASQHRAWWRATTAAVFATAALVWGVGIVEGQASLVGAVKRGDAAAARALLAKGADVNLAEADGTTPLHWAAEQDDAALAQALIAAGAKARVANRYGATPLHAAATNGNVALATALLSAGADVHAALPGGETPLMTAARAGHAAVIRALVAGGARVNDREPLKGQSALMFAAAEGNADAITVLAAAGAEVRAQTPGGFTALLFAVRGGHIAASQALLDAGANIEDAMPDGMSALVLALYNAHFELASALLDRGANPNAAKQGWTALHQVAWSRRPNRGFNMPGAVATGSIDSLDVVKKLVAKGADIDARMTKEPRDGNRQMLNRLGATPFLMAAKSDDLPLMRVLLQLGANPSLKTNEGTSAVMVAAGVGVNGPGESPGTAEEALEAVKLALEVGGGDVNDVDADGETALLGAVYRGGAVPVIQFLIDKGARLDVENAKKWSPLFAAEGVVYASSGIRRYPEAAALIRQAMIARGIQADESGRLIKTPAPVATPRSAAPSTAATPTRTNWDGVFTSAQATRGQAVYTRACAACHLDTLAGDAVSPTLLGPTFMNRFAGGNAYDMVTALRSSMPQNAPDSLGDQAYIDLVSFLLRANGGNEGANELPLDVRALQAIGITAARAAR